MRELPDIKSLARAPEQKVLKLWEGLGYYTRARNLHRAAQSLNGNRFPREYEEVLTLPGVGRYTAGAICSIAFNQATPVLDGNVRRVLSRLFATNEDLWDIARELVMNTRSCGTLNQALMELGAVVCAPREPRCGECPVASLCLARRLGRVAEFPAIVVLGVWFLMQFFQSVGSVTGNAGGVAYMAHVGGFLAGVLLLLIFRPRRSPQATLLI